MRSLSKSLVVTGLAGVFVLGMAMPAFAVETSNAEFVIIPEDDVFPEDLYAGAIRVVVEGTVEGDLVAFAAEEVVINGTVTGSVIAVTPRVTISGSVGESLRIATNALSLSGTVGGDVVGPAWTARFEPGSEVQRDVLIWAWEADALGTIGGDLTGSQRRLDLAGVVGGDVDVSVGSFEVPGELRVGGDLGFRSENPAVGLENAVVDGVVVEKAPLPPNLRVRALGLVGRFMVVLFLTLTALTVAYGWPGQTTAAIERVGVAPVRSWLRGALVLFSPLLAVLVTALILGFAPAAAAFSLLVVLVPLILALGGLAFAMTLVAGIPAVGWLGQVVFRRLGLYGAMLAGSVMAGLVWFLPVAGWAIPLLVLPLGLGAWMGTWGQFSEPERASNS
jgi:hypothetical protein